MGEIGELKKDAQELLSQIIFGACIYNQLSTMDWIYFLLLLLVLVIGLTLLVILAPRAWQVPKIGGAVKSKEHIIPIKSQIEYDQINQQLKTLVGLVYSPSYRVGDRLLLTRGDQKIKAEITDLEPYENIETFIMEEGPREVLPTAKTFQEALNAYQIHDAASERKRKTHGYGFLAIRFRIS